MTDVLKIDSIPVRMVDPAEHYAASICNMIPPRLHIGTTYREIADNHLLFTRMSLILSGAVKQGEEEVMQRVAAVVKRADPKQSQMRTVSERAYKKIHARITNPIISKWREDIKQALSGHKFGAQIESLLLKECLPSQPHPVSLASAQMAELESRVRSR